MPVAHEEERNLNVSADTPDTPENLFPAMPEEEWFELVHALEREIAVAWLDDTGTADCPPPARAAIEALRLLEKRGYLSPPRFHPDHEDE
jgi:hypothetical protein